MANATECREAYIDAFLLDHFTGWKETATRIDHEGVFVRLFDPNLVTKSFNSKISASYCVSFHCDELVAVFGKYSFSTLSIEWGTAEFPSVERSIIFEDSRGVSCVVFHAGGEEFREAAENRADGLLKRAEDFVEK